MSLASSTHTRVDSASKHIMPCKVHTDYMASLVGPDIDNAHRELQTNKHKYSVAKDDIVIGIGRPMYGSSIFAAKKRAYPPVISTLGQMQAFVRRFIALQNFLTKEYKDTQNLKAIALDIIGEPDTVSHISDIMVGQIGNYRNAKAASLPTVKVDQHAVQLQITSLMEFYFMGVSLGLAYAHPNTGDTVCSVMVGGMRTVLNGAFQIHTNDLLMFYFDDELPFFRDDGSRVDRGDFTMQFDTQDHANATWRTISGYLCDGDVPGATNSRTGLTQAETQRKNYHDRGNGNYPGQAPQKVQTAKIKPYIVSAFADVRAGVSGVQHFPCDKARIFGKALSNAQPFENVDIMLGRQSI